MNVYSATMNKIFPINLFTYIGRILVIYERFGGIGDHFEAFRPVRSVMDGMLQFTK